jgi:hypothetical protein
LTREKEKREEIWPCHGVLPNAMEVPEKEEEKRRKKKRTGSGNRGKSLGKKRNEKMVGG